MNLTIYLLLYTKPLYMHNPSISILCPGPDVMLIEGFDRRFIEMYLSISEYPS